MGVIFGGLSALLYGVGDFLGGKASQKVRSSSVVLWAGVISFPFIALAALIFGGEASPADWILGGVAGLLGAAGLVLLFAGLARGRAAAVAPSAAAVMAIFPVTVALILGERPSPLAWAGVALAVPAIVLCSWAVRDGDIKFGGLGYGLAAGIGFGAYVVLISQTGSASNLLPLIPARAASIFLILVLALGRVWAIAPVGSLPLGLVAANGLFDVTGNVTFLVGLRAGPLALVSVVAAMSPAVTVAMAALIDKEKLRYRQLVGVLLALVSLILITLG